MLFLALVTLSLLNQGTEHLKGSVKQRVNQVQAQVQTTGSSQVWVKPWSERPIVSAEHGKESKVNVSRDARDVLRESRYVVNELKQFANTLAGLGK